MSERDVYEATMQRDIEGWMATLAEMETDAARNLDEAAQSLLSEWREQGAAAGAKLAELKAAKGNRWDVVRPQMARAWEAIASLLEKARAGAGVEPGSLEDTNASTRITQRGMAVAGPDEALGGETP